MSDFKYQFLISAREELSKVASRASEAMERLESRYDKLRKAADRLAEAGRTSAMVGAGILAAGAGTVKAYADLEASTARLENALGTVHGMSPLLDKLKGQIVDLGNRLPGSTEDFTQLAEAMLSAGMPAQTLTDGALKAASALLVLSGQAPAETGRQFVQMANAMGIAGKDAEGFADVLQRLKTAAGLELPEIATAIPYMGDKLKGLRVQGLEASKEVLAVMGALKKAGVEGSMLGTTFEQFLTRTAMVSPRERFATGGLRGDSFRQLQARGIKLDFFDQAGNFRGLYQAIGELDKLRGLRQDLRLEVLQQLFGETGARMANVDLSQVRASAERMLEQENLMKRLDRITGTLKGRWDAAAGTFVNLAATIGERLAPSVGRLLDRMNGLLTFAQEWSSAHPRLVGSLGALTVAVGTITTVSGGALWTAGKLIGAWTTIRPVIALVGNVLDGTLVPALLSAGKAAWAFGAAFMSTPVGWITAAVVAIAAAGFLLWKNWDRIAGWFRRTFPELSAVFGRAWDQMRAAFAQLWASLKPLLADLAGTFGKAWNSLKAAMAPLMPVLLRLWEAIKPLVGPLLKAWAVSVLLPIAVGLGAIAAAAYGLIKGLTLLVKWWTICIDMGRKVLSFITGFYGTAFKAGAGLLEAFTKGISSAAMKPVEAIKSVLGKVRRFLPFSPAKEGPLSDIHKLRFMETIAESMSPGPLLDRMNRIAASTRTLAPRLATGAALMGGSLAMASGASRPVVQLTIQNIDARGAAPGVELDVRRALLAAVPELERELERRSFSNARRRF